MQSTINKPTIEKPVRGFVKPDDYVKVNVFRSADQFLSNRWYRSAFLASGDILAVALSFLCALAMSAVVRSWFDFPAPKQIVSSDALLTIFILPIVTLIWFSANWGHYMRIKPFWTEARELLKMSVYAGLLSIFVIFSIKADVSRVLLTLTLLFTICITPLFRLLAKNTLARLNRWYVPLLVVGEGSCLRDSIKAIESDSSLGYQVASTIEVHSSILWSENQKDDIAREIQMLGNQYHRPRLLLAFEHSDLLDVQEELADQVSSKFHQVIIGRPMQGLSSVNAEVLAIEKFDTLFIRLASNEGAMYSRLVKRLFDITVSFLALVLISPLLVLMGIMLSTQGGAVFYRSKRIGHKGKPFSCLKFRTMHVDAEARLADMLKSDAKAAEEWFSSFKLRDDPRITATGSFLRRTSLDELPQLWNVLIGDMSLVGPRPILPQEIDSYGNSAMRLYQSVRPGLTGLWQISGRDDVPYPERIALNQWYLRNWSHWLDISIIIRTVPALLGRDEAH